MYDEASVEQAISIVKRRSNRAIATILGVKDRDCDPYLSSGSSEKLRKTVMDQVNELADLAVDCIRSIPPEGSIANQYYLEKLEDIHKGIEYVVASLELEE